METKALLRSGGRFLAAVAEWMTSLLEEWELLEEAEPHAR